MAKKNNIKIQKGDIIDSEMQTIVFPINCTVSTGISPYFRKIYPKMQNYDFPAGKPTISIVG